MTARRRKWIIAATLLVLAAALWWCFGRDRGKLEVKFVFLGYTNDPVVTRTSPASSAIPTSWEARALILATNCGRVPALINRVRGSGDYLLREGFLVPFDTPYLTSGKGFELVLEPRETAMLHLHIPPTDRPWPVELWAERRTFKDRVYLDAWSAGNSSTKLWMMRTMGWPEQARIQLGAITNAPPDTAASDPPCVASP